MTKTVGFATIVIGAAWWVLAIGAAEPPSGPATEPSTQPSSATYVTTDTTTQGTWKKVYGTDGYVVIGDTQKLPAYAKLTVITDKADLSKEVKGKYIEYAWSGSTTDVRALQKAEGTDRIAAFWGSYGGITFDVNLTDNQAHRIALYCLDWGNKGQMAEKIEVLDAGTDAVLDTRKVKDFGGGQYLVWDIKGHVKLRLTTLAESRAGLSGLFFGPPLAPAAGAGGPSSQPATQPSTQPAKELTLDLGNKGLYAHPDTVKIGEDEKRFSTPTIVPQPFLVERKGTDWCPAKSALIVLADGAAEGERFAAAELARLLALRLKDAGNVPVVTRTNVEAGKNTPIFLYRAAEGAGGEPKELEAVTADWLGREGYAIWVGPDRIFVRGNSDVGLLYGVYAVAQALGVKGDVPGWPLMLIKDRPRFRFRGLLLDPARTYLDTDFLKRQIEMMALARLNVLHLHLTDDQGWTIESRKFPELVEKGARKDQKTGKGYYTQDEMKDLIAYGLKYGVNIMPEFEMPGHSGAVMKARPALMCQQLRGDAEKAKKQGTLCVGPESTYRFIEELMSEMAALFPFEYIHLGTDEAWGTAAWRDCPDCKARNSHVKRPGEQGLYAYFCGRAGQIVAKQGKTPMGWAEILAGQSEGLPAQSVAQVWGDSRSQVPRLLAAGRPVVLSHVNDLRIYLSDGGDRGYFAKGVLNWDMVNNVSRCASVLHCQRVLPEGTTSDQEKLCLGLESCVWGEIVPSVAEPTTWPRALAVAELAWSPDRPMHAAPQDLWPAWARLTGRLKLQREQTVQLKKDIGAFLTGGELQVEWLRPLHLKPQEFDADVAEFKTKTKAAWEAYCRTLPQFAEFCHRAQPTLEIMKARWQAKLGPLE